jgi:hypothetical protein
MQKFKIGDKVSWSKLGKVLTVKCYAPYSNTLIEFEEVSGMWNQYFFELVRDEETFNGNI